MIIRKLDSQRFLKLEGSYPYLLSYKAEKREKQVNPNAFDGFKPHFIPFEPENMWMGQYFPSAEFEFSYSWIYCLKPIVTHIIVPMDDMLQGVPIPDLTRGDVIDAQLPR